MVAALVVEGCDVACSAGVPLQAVGGGPPLCRAADRDKLDDWQETEQSRASPDLRYSDLPLPGGATRPEVCEGVAVVPGVDNHVVSSVGPTYDGAAPCVRGHPELVLLSAVLTLSGQEWSRSFWIFRQNSNKQIRNPNKTRLKIYCCEGRVL